MNASKPQEDLEKTRADIARKVRDLRVSRHWTQTELSQRLGFSQARLSEIENGAGSFTAEQFLTILKLFNVAPSHFAPKAKGDDLELQNALARFGATHLQESENVVPSDRFHSVGDLVSETLVTAESPRLVTALAPVLVRHANGLHPKKLQLRLGQVGADRRFAWLVENTVEGVRSELQQSLPRAWSKLYRRADVVLGAFLDSIAVERGAPIDLTTSAPDVLDADIRSRQTLQEVVAASSAISRRWGIATSLQLEDFAVALRAARAAN